MNKTPQEQAQVLATTCADGLWEVGEGHKQDYMKLAPNFISENLALPELIAVAQAAQHNPNCSSGYNLQCDCNHRNLKQALQALRATRKVEL